MSFFSVFLAQKGIFRAFLYHFYVSLRRTGTHSEASKGVQDRFKPFGRVSEVFLGIFKTCHFFRFFGPRNSLKNRDFGGAFERI